jgi:DnaJ-class molecular chaperone
MAEYITCPDCGGRGESFVHLSTTTGGYTRWMDCMTCGGATVISVEHGERIAEGNRRREDRKTRLMTLRDEAKRLGISPSELSRIENGRES